jgi:hypothetical protein
LLFFECPPYWLSLWRTSPMLIEPIFLVVNFVVKIQDK